jgi:hypothetical protein
MRLQAHPPERRRRSTVLAAHGCCCCCCCLHTIGGIVAAAVESSRASTPQARLTVRTYWWLTLGSTVLGFAGIALQEGAGPALLALILCLPVAQLNASFLSLLIHMFTPLDLRTVGRLAWKSTVWAGIGFLLWFGPCVMTK